MTATIGHNSKAFKEEAELSFREKTRAQRIKENTPFDLRWQWEVWLSDLSSSAMLVAFAIRIYADRSGSSSNPSIETLQRLTKLSRNTVLTAIRELGKTDLVRKEIGAGRARNSYSMAIPDQTVREIAEIIDFRSGSVIEPQASRASSSMDEPQARSGSLTEPKEVVQPLNHKPVVVQSLDRSGSTIEPDLTKDITENKKGDALTRDPAPSGSMLGKAVAAIATGLAATALPAAATPVTPPSHVSQSPHECWLNGKAQMEAAMSPYERRAQFQVWVTPMGVIEVAGEFREELLREYPLVDLKCGLATASTNVNPGHGAINAMKAIRRQFGFSQQDAEVKEKREKARQEKMAATRQESREPDYRKFYEGAL
jgi:hypothetical protein